MARAAALALLLGVTEGALNLRDRRLDEADVDLGCIFDCDWVQGDDVNVCVSFDSEEDCSSDCTEDVVDWLTEACTGGYNCLADCAWLQYSYSYDLCEYYDPDDDCVQDCDEETTAELAICTAYACADDCDEDCQNFFDGECGTTCTEDEYALVLEMCSGGGGSYSYSYDDVPACLDDCDNDCDVFLAGRCGLSCTEDEAMWAEESCAGGSYSYSYAEYDGECSKYCATCDGPGWQDCDSCENGCAVEDDDDRDGYGSCPSTCDEATPAVDDGMAYTTTTVDDAMARSVDGGCVDSALWHKIGAPAKDCAWVANYAARCAVKGEEDGHLGKSLASYACPAACGTTCGDSSSWYKRGDPTKTCQWVASWPDARCLVKGEDKVLAADACVDSC